MIIVTGSDSLVAINGFKDDPKVAQLIICAVMWISALALAILQKKFPLRFIYAVPALYFLQHIYDLVKAQSVFG